MFTPTLRCECAQPGLIDTMRKWSIQQCILHIGFLATYWKQTCFFSLMNSFLLNVNFPNDTDNNITYTMKFPV